MDRRKFLRRSGLGRGGRHRRVPAHARAQGPGGRCRRAPAGGAKVEVKRTVCGHCSVGCAVDAVVENGVWVRQEPVFDSPLNLGAHCAKGAAVRETRTANSA
jgi:formate dehydrogenase major subunit